MQEPKLEISPFCRDLRSKKYFFLDGPPRTEEELLDGSNYCWCQRTKLQLGPDDEPADAEDCQKQRECFTAYGS